jgi:hypothetical protein
VCGPGLGLAQDFAEMNLPREFRSRNTNRFA